MTDSRIKIIISFLLIIALSMMRHWYFPIAISVLCILLASRLHLIRDYFKKLTYPVVLSLFILAVHSLTYGIETIDFMGIIPLHTEGIAYGFLIFSRVFASASVLVILVLTTSENEMLKSMRDLGIPGTMLEIASFMIRYIKAFSMEGKKMKLAQESRCGFSKGSGYTGRMKNIASISGALIVRAFARSEEVYRAMISRAWNPENSAYAIRKLDREEILFGFVYSFGIFAMLGLDVLL